MNVDLIITSRQTCHSILIVADFKAWPLIGYSETRYQVIYASGVLGANECLLVESHFLLGLKKRFELVKKRLTDELYTSPMTIKNPKSLHWKMRVSHEYLKCLYGSHYMSVFMRNVTPGPTIQHLKTENTD